MSFERQWDIFIVIKLFENPKKFGELVVLFICVIMGLVHFYHLDELPHYVWEYCNSKHEAESNENSFEITFWMKVSKADCSQRGEWEVKHNKYCFPNACYFYFISLCKMITHIFWTLMKIVPVHKIVLYLETVFEKHCKKVAGDSDKYQKFYEFY